MSNEALKKPADSPSANKQTKTIRRIKTPRQQIVSRWGSLCPFISTIHFKEAIVRRLRKYAKEPEMAELTIDEVEMVGLRVREQLMLETSLLELNGPLVRLSHVFDTH